MDEEIELNRISNMATGKRKLPDNIKPIQIGEKIYLFKKAFSGWKQLPKDEDIRMRQECGIND